eukprot:5028885-Amphidinium_carterae.1
MKLIPFGLEPDEATHRVEWFARVSFRFALSYVGVALFCCFVELAINPRPLESPRPVVWASVADVSSLCHPRGTSTGREWGTNECGCHLRQVLHP